ncbi:serine/threonine-protein kinase [Piscinibacter terrae]|uniref:Serine/threonine protein kinase n=1 Tax=Piscinibacter terrae TaxID=2496871 RepID=A0A3N7JSB7_9BURK|nr:serine/threonine-protein kinase [Albitalea terrae]RQP23869.1 serine/threonine protein kinase [Albitalea terrae]
MNRTPEQQWSALSALYEEADGMRADELQAWLERLEREGNPLLPQLRLMLDARSHLETDDFLGTLPRLSSDAANASDWHEDDRVGPYRLVKPLGEGGMAEVWLAERADGAFKRQVAIKLPYPRPGRETFAARFDRERDILATLRHPHIAGLYDAGVTKEGQAWLALEYVEGQPISTFCDERKLPVRERVQLFRQVLLAVQHAHANLVIHRDLKPGNILVTSQGEVRLLDFGIAKLLEAQGDAIEETELTRQAGRSMTPRYASPEQLMGLPLTTACDVYSLGVVFYELICGERPYELRTESAAQLEHAILEVDPRAPSRRSLGDEQAEPRGTSPKGLRKLLAPELDAIALRCLEKKPSSRYSSVDAVLADVDRWLAGEAVLAKAPSAYYRLWKFAGRHRLGVGLGLASIVSLVVVATAAVVFGLQAREESARAGAARDFMLNLFKRADQEKARGADITARELLETGRKDVLTRLKTQPRLQSELLLGIANIQKDMGEFVGADSTFADAARVYAELGQPRDAALALTAQSNMALRSGNLKQARTLLQEAREMDPQHGNEPELNARMSEVEGWIAEIQGDSKQAKTLFERSHEQALKAFGPNHPKTMDALRGRIYTAQRMQDYDGALQLLGQLESAVMSTHSADARELASLAVDRSGVLSAAGQYAAQLEHLRGAVARCAADLGPNGTDCRSLAIRKVLAQLRLGLVDDAVEELPSLEAISEDQKSPTLGAEAALLIFKISAAKRILGKDSKEYLRIRTLAESSNGASANKNYRMKGLMALAEFELRQGDLTTAQEWLAKLDSLLLRPDGSLPISVDGAIAMSMRGIAEFQRGEKSDAQESLRQALERVTQVFGAKHPAVQFYAANLALVTEAMGQTSSALEIVKKVEPVLRQSLGAEAPTYLRIRKLQDRLELTIRSPDLATEEAGRRRSVPGTRLSIDFF